MGHVVDLQGARARQYGKAKLIVRQDSAYVDDRLIRMLKHKFTTFEIVEFPVVKVGDSDLVNGTAEKLLDADVVLLLNESPYPAWSIGMMAMLLSVVEHPVRLMNVIDDYTNYRIQEFQLH